MNPRQLTREYQKGLMTLTEVVIKASKAALSAPPESFADSLPDECLDQLRASSKQLIQTPEWKARVCWMGSGHTLADYEEESRLFREGLFRWQSYFIRTDPTFAEYIPGQASHDSE